METVLLQVRNVHLFKIPPRQTSRGYKANDWDVSQHLFTGRLRILGQGSKCFIKFEDTKTVLGQLFAQCNFSADANSVEQVQDSSRYFVVKVEDPTSGKHAFLGLGFDERNDAFDFNVTLQDFGKQVKQEKDLKNKVTQPAVDFSLKSNAKLSISIGQKKGKDAANENTDSDQQLDSPLKPVSNISFATSSKTTPTNWVKF